MKAGDKVVCLDDYYFRTVWLRYGFKIPVKNEVYTVRSIRYFNERHYKGYAIRLEEIVNPIFEFPNMTDEIHWRAKYFQVLQKEESSEEWESVDISPLTRHLEEVAVIGHYSYQEELCQK